MRTKNTLQAGLDINEHNIKLLVLEENQRGLRVHTQIQLPANEIAQLKKHKLPPLTISIPNESVLSNTTFVDAGLSDDKIESQLNEKIPQLFPNVNADLYVDFFVLETQTEQQIKKILVLAAHRELIEEKITFLKNNGINVYTVEMNGYAILRGLHHIDAPNPNNTMIIHFNEHDVELIITSTFIVAHQKIVWQPTMGGQRLTNALTQAIHFLNASSGNVQVKEILLSGEPTELLEKLQETIKIPLRSIHFQTPTLGASWLVALGLALRNLV